MYIYYCNVVYPYVGRTALSHAAEDASLDVIKLLISSGSDIRNVSKVNSIVIYELCYYVQFRLNVLLEILY